MQQPANLPMNLSQNLSQNINNINALKLAQPLNQAMAGLSLNQMNTNPLTMLNVLNNRQPIPQGRYVQNRYYDIPDPDTVREVWANNLHEEFAVIRQLVKQFKYVAVSTEIPGVVARPIGRFSTTQEYHYQTMRVNLDMVSMVQLSLTLADLNGKRPSEINPSVPLTWQFNFKFDLKTEMYGADAIADLKRTGVQFEKLETQGIEHTAFAEMLYDLGLILGPDTGVTWISFNCGYDFGCLVRLLTNTAMPVDTEGFLLWCRRFFLGFYDVKYIAAHQLNLLNTGDPGSSGEFNFKRFNLENLADSLGIPVQQSLYMQSGNQLMLTSACFFELRRLIGLASKEAGALASFKNLIWGIDKNNETLIGHSPQYMAMDNMAGTPMQIPMNVGMMNSPVYLTR